MRLSHCFALAAIGTASLLAKPVLAQSDLTAEQRENYARQFQAAPIRDVGSRAQVATAATSSQTQQESGVREEQRRDYADRFKASVPSQGASREELRMLLDAQEMRITVPAEADELRTYLERNRALLDIPEGTTPVLKYLLMWNHVALDATAIDHTTLGGGESTSSLFGEQFGPTRTSRVLAIVHLAMFEAVNSISRKYTSYKDVRATILDAVGVPMDQISPETASVDRAVVEAAYLTLVELYPKKKNLLDIAYELDRVALGDVADDQGQRPSKMILGAEVGKQAALAILELRHFDGSELPDLSSDDFESPNPETWHQDPISKLLPALGGNWPRVDPFVIATADAFRPGTRGDFPETAPSFDSPEFIEAYKEVKRLGGDPNALPSVDRWPTATVRTGAANPDDPDPSDNTNQTFVGIFWGYDGTALLCAPPRLYNMIATSVALKEKPITQIEDMAYYLVLVNVSMADACIAAWDAKYHFLFPRPVTYLRAVNADQTSEGSRNLRWTPLGAPVTNGTAEGRNLTPPFPSYPSGHAAFGGALFKAMALYFQSVEPAFPDAGIAFDFVSDEYNGNNRSPGNETPRTSVTAHFESFQEAEFHNAQSRIFIGIHWSFDATHGIKQGNLISEHVFENFVEEIP